MLSDLKKMLLWQAIISLNKKQKMYHTLKVNNGPNHLYRAFYHYVIFSLSFVIIFENQLIIIIIPFLIILFPNSERFQRPVRWAVLLRQRVLDGFAHVLRRGEPCAAAHPDATGRPPAGDAVFCRQNIGPARSIALHTGKPSIPTM